MTPKVPRQVPMYRNHEEYLDNFLEDLAPINEALRGHPDISSPVPMTMEQTTRSVAPQMCIESASWLGIGIGRVENGRGQHRIPIEFGYSLLRESDYREEPRDSVWTCTLPMFASTVFLDRHVRRPDLPLQYTGFNDLRDRILIEWEDLKTASGALCSIRGLRAGNSFLSFLRRESVNRHRSKTCRDWADKMVKHYTSVAARGPVVSATPARAYNIANAEFTPLMQRYFASVNPSKSPWVLDLPYKVYRDLNLVLPMEVFIRNETTTHSETYRLGVILPEIMWRLAEAMVKEEAPVLMPQWAYAVHATSNGGFTCACTGFSSREIRFPDQVTRKVAAGLTHAISGEGLRSHYLPFPLSKKQPHSVHVNGWGFKTYLDLMELGMARWVEDIRKRKRTGQWPRDEDLKCALAGEIARTTPILLHQYVRGGVSRPFLVKCSPAPNHQPIHSYRWTESIPGGQGSPTSNSIALERSRAVRRVLGLKVRELKGLEYVP